jgi:hypothetical protein
MPQRVKDLPSFFREVGGILQLITECRAVLFRRGFRELVPEAARPAQAECNVIASQIQDLEPNSPAARALHQHGLDGAQLDLKLESFEHALFQFEAEGGETNLHDVLDRAHIILGSFGGAIPVFGPFAKELIDFFNKELRRRFRNSGIS